MLRSDPERANCSESFLEAFEAYKIITGVGKVTVAPKILTFDLLDLGSFSLDEL